MLPEFRGPFPLNVETVDVEITKISPGNYRVGFKNVGGDFIPYYVGRSDENLNQRLKDWVVKYDLFTAASMRHRQKMPTSRSAATTTISTRRITRSI